MLVEVDDLIAYMDIKFSNRQTRAAQFVLEGLQSELESYLRRPIEVGSFTDDYVIPFEDIGYPESSFFYDRSLDTTNTSVGAYQPPLTVYLRNSPVASVLSVYVSTPSSASVTPTLQSPNTDYVVRRYGIDMYRAFPNDKVTVTYTAGLDGPEIKVFKLLILRAAAREMQNMHDDVVGLKDLETRNVAPLTTGFTAEELKSVSRWKRKQIA